MSFNLEAEISHAKALDKEKDKIIKAIKKAGYKYNGENENTEIEFEKDKGIFVIQLTIS